MSYEHTIKHFEQQLAEEKQRYHDNEYSWPPIGDRQWVASRLQSLHHWQALEEYLAREADG